MIIEVPHFASTRGKEREITILRSDTGESWREHTLEASEEAVQEVLNESFEGEGNFNRIDVGVLIGTSWSRNSLGQLGDGTGFMTTVILPVTLNVCLFLNYKKPQIFFLTARNHTLPK